MNDEKLNAYLDNELSDGERAEVEQRLQDDPELAARLVALRDLDEDLRDTYAGAVDETSLTVREFRFPRGRRRWIIPLVTAAAGLLVGLFVSRGSPIPFEPTSLGLVTVATNTLQLTLDGGQPAECRAGTLLPERCVLTAATNTRAAVALTDGSELRLDRGASVRLAGNRAIEVLGGRVWSRVAPGDPFSVDAGETKITVLGTQLSVQRTAESTKVQLYSGSASVEAVGAVQQLAAGQQISFADGKLQRVRTMRSMALATGWMVELYKHMGKEDQEMIQHMDRLLVELGRMKMNLDEQEVVTELHEICRVPVSRYLVSDVAQLELEQRRKAARVLMQIADDSVVVPLIQALDDSDPEVRVYAAHALRNITNAMICGNPDAFRNRNEAQLEALKQQAREYLARRNGERK